MAEKTMTDEDFDLAVGSVTSFYQSKREKLKQQVTGWMGKFRICKFENNKLRSINKAVITRNEELFGMVGKLDKEVTDLKAELQEARSLAGVCT